MELCQAMLLLSENWCHSVLGGAAVWSGAGVAVHRPPGDGEGVGKVSGGVEAINIYTLYT